LGSQALIQSKQKPVSEQQELRDAMLLDDLMFGGVSRDVDNVDDR